MSFTLNQEIVRFFKRDYNKPPNSKVYTNLETLSVNKSDILMSTQIEHNYPIIDITDDNDMRVVFNLRSKPSVDEQESSILGQDKEAAERSLICVMNSHNVTRSRSGRIIKSIERFQGGSYPNVTLNKTTMQKVSKPKNVNVPATRKATKSNSNSDVVQRVTKVKVPRKRKCSPVPKYESEKNKSPKLTKYTRSIVPNTTVTSKIVKGHLKKITADENTKKNNAEVNVKKTTTIDNTKKKNAKPIAKKTTTIEKTKNAKQNSNKTITKENMKPKHAEENIQKTIGKVIINPKIVVENVLETIAKENIKKTIAKENIKKTIAKENTKTKNAKQNANKTTAEENIKEKNAEPSAKKTIDSENIKKKNAKVNLKKASETENIKPFNKKTQKKSKVKPTVDKENEKPTNEEESTQLPQNESIHSDKNIEIPSVTAGKRTKKRLEQKQQRQEKLLKVMQSECDDDYFSELPTAFNKFKLSNILLNSPSSKFGTSFDFEASTPLASKSSSLLGNCSANFTPRTALLAQCWGNKTAATPLTPCSNTLNSTELAQTPADPMDKKCANQIIFNNRLKRIPKRLLNKENKTEGGKGNSKASKGSVKLCPKDSFGLSAQETKTKRGKKVKMYSIPEELLVNDSSNASNGNLEEDYYFG